MILEIVVLLVFVAFVLSGWRKGLLLSLCGLLVFVFSCLGAVVAMEAFTEPMTEWMQPKVEAAVQERIREELTAQVEEMMKRTGETGFSVGGEQMELSGLLEFLSRLGFDVEQQVQDSIAGGTEPVVAEVSRCIAEFITQKAAPALVFSLGFLLIYLVMQILVLGLNVVRRVPGIGTLDHIGGAAIGAVNGLIVLLMFAGVLSISGIGASLELSEPISTLLRQMEGMFVH